MERNKPLHQKTYWNNRISGKPVMPSERMSVTRSMQNDQKQRGMIKVGDWNSPGVVDKLIQVGI